MEPMTREVGKDEQRRLNRMVRKIVATKGMDEDYSQTRQDSHRWLHPEPAVVASPSLEDALRERPARPGDVVRYQEVTRVGPTTMIYHGASVPTDTRALASPLQRQARTTDPRVVVSAMWTPAEYRTYERLTAMVCAPVISERARAQVWLKKFVEKHGKDKCEMMLAEIRRRDEVEWFKDKMRTKGA